MALFAVEEVDVDCAAVGDSAVWQSVLAWRHESGDSVGAHSEISLADRNGDMADR